MICTYMTIHKITTKIKAHGKADRGRHAGAASPSRHALVWRGLLPLVVISRRARAADERACGRLQGPPVPGHPPTEGRPPADQGHSHPRPTEAERQRQLSVLPRKDGAKGRSCARPRFSSRGLSRQPDMASGGGGAHDHTASRRQDALWNRQPQLVDQSPPLSAALDGREPVAVAGARVTVEHASRRFGEQRGSARRELHRRARRDGGSDRPVRARARRRSCS